MYILFHVPFPCACHTLYWHLAYVYYNIHLAQAQDIPAVGKVSMVCLAYQSPQQAAVGTGHSSRVPVPHKNICAA
jgi:hypothetical protein